MMATQADAHREWHLNTGTKVGVPSFPSCPWDCAAGADDHEVS